MRLGPAYLDPTLLYHRSAAMSSIEPKRYDAFLSYNSHDHQAVAEVAGRLKDEGLELYLAEWELTPGREFQPALAEGLHRSQTCVVFLGPKGLGPWQKQELQVAIDKRAGDQAFRVIPVLLPGTKAPRRGDVAHLDFLINASWVVIKTLKDDRAFEKLVWGIKGKKLPELDATRYEGVCPYRGLEAFRPEDEQFFFGRVNLTEWLISALRSEVRETQGVRFLGVLGPSGSGKSSVVLAGLVPKLKMGEIEGSERWPVAILRPGDDPLKNLAAEIMPRFLPAGALPDAAQVLKLIDDLRADARTLDVFAQIALRDQPEDVRLAVVVDQFEEVFTNRPQDDQARVRFEQDRDRFFTNLLQAAATPGGRVAVVLTMRSDFLSACAAFPQLAAVLSAHQEVVGPMTAAELREAIEQPAFHVGCEVEPGLTERLLADVKGQAGALPLLQFALTEVWKKRDVRRLTLRAYTELGKDDKGEQRGMEGVLEHRANEIYCSLNAEDQDHCRRIFLRLVQPGEGTEDTKRRVSYRELLPDDPTRAEAVKRLIRTLADRDARLVTTEGTDAADVAVEVAHEALIRGWTQLRRWVDAERAGLRTQRRLTEQAQEWAAAESEHKEDYLYSGARLAVAREWVEAHGGELSRIEAAFLAVSEEAERQRKQDEVQHERRLREAAEASREAERKHAEEADARKRDAEAAARRQKQLGSRFLAAAVVAGVLAAVSTLAAIWLNTALGKAREAERLARLREAEALEGQARGIRYSGQPGQRFEALAALKKAVAIGRELGQSPEWFDRLRNEAIAALALPDVHITRSWDGFPPGTYRAELSPDFQLYARTASQGACSVRRVADDIEIARLPELGEPARAGFGPGSLLVLYGESSKRLQLWDLSGPEPIRRLDQRHAENLSNFSADGQLIAVGFRDGSLGVYATDTGKRLHHLAAQGIPRNPLPALHATEPVVATCSYYSNLLQIRDLQTGAVRFSLTLPWRRSAMCAWSPDGRTLAISAAEVDGEGDRSHLYAFDAPTRSLCRTHVLRGESNGGTAIEFNPAGDLLATRGWNGKVHLFDVHTGQKLFVTHALPCSSMPPLLRFDPTGTLLAAARVGTHENQIGLWSVSDAREYRALLHVGLGPNEQLEHGIGTFAIHPDGRLAVQAFKDGLALFDLETGRELKPIKLPRVSGCVCFDGAGNLLTNGFAGFFRWPVRPDPTRPGQLTVGPPEQLPFKHGNRQIAASRDATVIAQAMYHGYRMWFDRGGWVVNPNAPKPVNIAKGESMVCASVHPSGRWVAFGRHMNRVNVYEAATGQRVWQSPADRHNYCRFSSDGRWLVSDSEGGRAYSVGGTWQPGPPLGPGIPWDVSPDGCLVVLGQTEGVYRLVELATGREVARLEDPKRTAGAAVFTPDGTRLVAAGQDGLRVWDLRRIRAELAKLDLDWAAEPYRPGPEPATVPPPLTVTVEMGDILKNP
jgi:WD40 repeat protein